MSRQRKSIGKRLQALRKARGMSQKQLANCIGVHSSTISRYESSQTEKIMNPIIDKIAEVLETDPDWLLKGEISETSANSNPVLSESEFQLIKLYRELNQEGQDLAFTQMENLHNIEKYLLDEDIKLSEELFKSDEMFENAEICTGQYETEDIDEKDDSEETALIIPIGDELFSYETRRL